MMPKSTVDVAGKYLNDLAAIRENLRNARPFLQKALSSIHNDILIIDGMSEICHAYWRTQVRELTNALRAIERT